MCKKSRRLIDNQADAPTPTHIHMEIQRGERENNVELAAGGAYSGKESQENSTKEVGVDGAMAVELRTPDKDAESKGNEASVVGEDNNADARGNATAALETTTTVTEAPKPNNSSHTQNQQLQSSNGNAPKTTTMEIGGTAIAKKTKDDIVEEEKITAAAAVAVAAESKTSMGEKTGKVNRILNKTNPMPTNVFSQRNAITRKRKKIRSAREMKIRTAVVTAATLAALGAAARIGIGSGSGKETGTETGTVTAIGTAKVASRPLRKATTNPVPPAKRTSIIEAIGIGKRRESGSGSDNEIEKR